MSSSCKRQNTQRRPKMTILIQEFDGDPQRQRPQRRNAQSSSSVVGPVCRAEYVISEGGEGGENGVAAGKGATSNSSRHFVRRRESSLSNAPFGELCRHYLVSAPRRVFVDLFLPVGYPQSVGDGYLQYQVYDSLQGICSYLRGVVSTSAVLMAAGVGDAEATAMSAAMAWAMRDGLGMIGGLLFSYCASSQFDQCVKEYRLFADVINDVGLTLDMLAPYAGRARVLYVTSLATVCKVMCGMAAGATKGSITHHFAVRGNMADLNAKESTQETLVSLIGMICGIALARYLHYLERLQMMCDTPTANDEARGLRRFLSKFKGGQYDEEDDSCISAEGNTAAMVSWGIFVFLTIVHVWANYLGVKLLRLRTLNRERAEVAFADVIDTCTARFEQLLMDDNRGNNKNKHVTDNFALDVGAMVDSIPAPEDVSESLWSSTRKLFFPGGVHLGVRLSQTIKGMSDIEVAYALHWEFRNERYILSVASSPGLRRSASVKVYVSLLTGATERDELKAFLHAMIARRVFERSSLVKSIQDLSPDDWKSTAVTITHQSVDELFGDQRDQVSAKRTLSLETLSERGWDCNRLYLGVGPWRVQWESDKEE